MTTDCKRCKGWYNPCAPDDYPDYVDDPDNCAYFEKREGEGMTTEEMFKKELSELLRKYDCALSAEDHWQGYAECGQDVRMTVEFNDYRLSDIDLGRYFDGGEKP